jgi:hypothetical protein
LIGDEAPSSSIEKAGGATFALDFVVCFDELSSSSSTKLISGGGALLDLGTSFSLAKDSSLLASNSILLILERRTHGGKEKPLIEASNRKALKTGR